MNKLMETLTTVLALSGVMMGSTSVLANQDRDATVVGSQSITHAVYVDPTDRYGEYVMGPAIHEHATLRVYDQSLNEYEVTLSADGDRASVFEAKLPRIADIDGDGANDVVVVETSITQGASLAVYSIRGGRLTKIAQNDYQRKRPQWLAIAGIADFDQDGKNEIAYVERPHGYNHLTFWKLSNAQLEKVADLEGLTGHIEKDDRYQFAIRVCGTSAPELILNDSTYENIYGVSYQEGVYLKTQLEPYRNESSSFAISQRCQ